MRALDAVTLSLASEMRMVAVCGRSGSGKTTLLNILGALDLPSSGRVVVDGADLTRLTERDRVAYRRTTVGIVFQTFNLIPNLTALENVIVPMEFAGLPRRRRRERALEVFFDYDNDGDLDLVMTNGVAFVSEWATDRMRFWGNDGAGRMRDRSAAVGLMDSGTGMGLLTFDYDRDGDLDLFIVTNAGTPILYRNDRDNGNAWLRVRVVGAASNRDGIGARIVVTPVPGEPQLVREVGLRSHFLGQSELTEHFGPGAGALEVAELTVVWPRSGLTTVVRNVPSDQTIVIREGEDGFMVEGG